MGMSTSDAPLAAEVGTGAREKSVSVEERDLLLSLARGDRGAAEALVDRTYARTYSLLCQLCDGNRDLAADLTQDTYRRAWAALAGFDGRSQLATWLYRIAYNTFLNHVRRPHRIVPLEDEVAVAVRDAHPAADDALVTAETDARLRRAVLGLPDELRATVVARFWAELQVSEIAAADGIGAAAVRKRLRKALALLGAVLEEES